MSIIDDISNNTQENNNIAFSGKQNQYYGPDGRLLMVENAIEAVRKGSKTIGMRTDEFALLVSHIKPTMPLVDPSEKIFHIDYHIGATGSGHIGDMLQLIDELRLISQKYRLAFDGPIDINSITRQISSYFHAFTIYSIRPQAVSLLLVGADNSGIKLFQIDPSGTHLRGSGFAIGSSSEVSLTFMQKEYRKNMSVDQAIQVTYNAIEKAIGKEPLLEGGIITQKYKLFNKINILEYIKK